MLLGQVKTPNTNVQTESHVSGSISTLGWLIDVDHTLTFFGVNTVPGCGPIYVMINGYPIWMNMGSTPHQLAEHQLPARYEGEIGDASSV